MEFMMVAWEKFFLLKTAAAKTYNQKPLTTKRQNLVEMYGEKKDLSEAFIKSSILFLEELVFTLPNQVGGQKGAVCVFHS